MLNVKKLASVIIAGVLSASSLQIINGFAGVQGNRTSHDSRDVNESGAVDLFDVTALNKYLNSINVESNQRFLDVNDNSIVSSVDSNCILSNVLGMNNFESKVEGCSSTFQAYTSYETKNGMPYTTQSYEKHLYSGNDTNHTQYTLHISQGIREADDPNMPGVILEDGDGRVPDSTKGIVYLSNGATGFLVDDNIIATSAHCVYNRQTGKWIQNVKVYPKTNNGVVDNTVWYNAVEAHIPTNFFTNSNDMYDYALIKIGTSLTGSDYPHLKLGMPYNVYTNSNFEDYTIYASGFPGKIPGGHDNSDPPQLYTGAGNLRTEGDIDENLICFTSDVSPGTSGGPVYVKEKYRNGSSGDYNETITVISIVSGIYNFTSPHYNMGPTMNPMMLKFYLNNEYLS